ncbi:MAG TPA: hypothetical protein VGH79_01645 [Gaiellaceae bacterium]|jgi:hypothetical protein
MPQHDGQLFELIQELTECGLVWPLDSAVDVWDRERVKRVIADGFAVVRRRGSDLHDDTFIPTDQANTAIDHLRTTDEYVLIAAPWVPIDPEYELDLVTRYAADEPEAIAEVRRAHSEKRARLCR